MHSEAVVEHKMQQRPWNEVIQGSREASVQTVSGMFGMTSRMGVDAEREGGDVEKEAVFARRCRVSVDRIGRQLAR